MGQKVNPHGLRVGIIKDWDSRWITKNKDFGDTLVSDYNLRVYLKKTLYAAGVPKIEIERDANRVKVTIYCAKPGIIIGKGGAEIDKLQAQCEALLGKPAKVSIVEVRNPDMNAQLVAEGIASQLEKRIAFRRAMKQAIGRSMKMGAKGIKTQVSGRLNGAEIARTEHYHEGTIPLQTLRADIDYGFAEANTTYGRLGVKVWIYRGEVLAGTARQRVEEAARPPRRDGDRPPRRDGDRPRRDGDRSRQGGGFRQDGGNRSGGGFRQDGGNRTGGAPRTGGGRPPRKEGGQS